MEYTKLARNKGVLDRKIFRSGLKKILNTNKINNLCYFVGEVELSIEFG